jgi:hypothetical protein
MQHFLLARVRPLNHHQEALSNEATQCQSLSQLMRMYEVQVRAVKLRRDRIAVALDHRILVYNFADLRLIYQWETIHNSKGLLAMSTQVDNTVVACPGVHVGQVSFLGYPMLFVHICSSAKCTRFDVQIA